MVDQGPLVAGAQQGCWEDDGVEGDVVLGHELVELNLVWVAPPPLPLRRVARSHGDVADRGVVPHVEHLANMGGGEADGKRLERMSHEHMLSLVQHRVEDSHDKRLERTSREHMLSLVQHRVENVS